MGTASLLSDKSILVLQVARVHACVRQGLGDRACVYAIN
jgi:hypothetical protein